MENNINPVPEIIDFHVSKEEISDGETLDMFWKTQNAKSVMIETNSRRGNTINTLFLNLKDSGQITFTPNFGDILTIRLYLNFTEREIEHSTYKDINVKKRIATTHVQQINNSPLKENGNAVSNQNNMAENKKDDWWVNVLWYGAIILVGYLIISHFNKNGAIFGTKVTDQQVERQQEENNTFKNDDEVINAVLYQYGVGSTIKDYTISSPTGYCQVGEYQNYSNKRRFSVEFNLTNGRKAVLKGVATKQDGNINVSEEELVLE